MSTNSSLTPHEFRLKPLVLAVVLLTLGLVSCSPDERLDPSYAPQIKSAAFYGANNAWLVTSRGDLLRTDNGGDTWETVRAEDAGGFDSITFIDERTGWAGSKDGHVLRSTDGGISWVSTVKLSESKYGPGVGQIQFLDGMHGWVVHSFFFWRTEDGGSTWQPSASPSAPGQKVNYCSFVDPQRGWLSGSGGLSIEQRTEEELGIIVQWCWRTEVLVKSVLQISS